MKYKTMLLLFKTVSWFYLFVTFLYKIGNVIIIIDFRRREYRGKLVELVLQA